MTLKCLDSDVAQWKRVWLITRRSVDQNHPSLLYKNNILPISRSLADRVGSTPRVGNLINLTVDLSEWSKEPGLGPGMFACVGSNPSVNILFSKCPYGPMVKAPVYGTGDSRFKS